MKEVKWIYYCKPTDTYIYSCDDRGRFESEEEAIKWCEEKGFNFKVYTEDTLEKMGII